MTPDTFANALQHLDPGSRALLDLSLRRGLDDAEIAELLGADSEYISDSREAAIAQLAEDLGMHGDPDAVREALEDMPEDAWRPATGEAVEPEPAGAPAEVEPEPEPDPIAHEEPAEAAPRYTPVAPRTRRSRLLLSGMLLAGIVLALALALSGGSGDQKRPSTPAAPNPGPGKSAPLTSLGARGKGTASLDGRNLTLAVAGLANPVGGSYEVWLYNDQIDARPLTSFRSGSQTVKAELPARTAGYRYVDVSLEPSDGNPNHSGQSVLRVQLRALR